MTVNRIRMLLRTERQVGGRAEKVGRPERPSDFTKTVEKVFSVNTLDFRLHL